MRRLSIAFIALLSLPALAGANGLSRPRTTAYFVAGAGCYGQSCYGGAGCYGAGCYGYAAPQLQAPVAPVTPVCESCQQQQFQAPAYSYAAPACAPRTFAAPSYSYAAPVRFRASACTAGYASASFAAPVYAAPSAALFVRGRHSFAVAAPGVNVFVGR